MNIQLGEAEQSLQAMASGFLHRLPISGWRRWSTCCFTSPRAIGTRLLHIDAVRMRETVPPRG